MNKKYKQLWIEALRSGEYKQTKRFLKNEGGYCCLGVLCDIYPKGNWDIYNRYHYLDEDNSVAIPYTLKKELKIHYDEESHLMSLNDSGKDFIEISNYIEENL